MRVWEIKENEEVIWMEEEEGINQKGAEPGAEVA
jgi:hypothetical protein